VPTKLKKDDLGRGLMLKREPKISDWYLEAVARRTNSNRRVFLISWDGVGV
jgi:hypothetical protein